GIFLDDGQVFIRCLLCLFEAEIDVARRSSWGSSQFPEEQKGIVSRGRSFQDEQELIPAGLGVEFLRPVNGDVLEGKGSRIRNSAQDDSQCRSVQRAEARDHYAPLQATQVQDRGIRFVARTQFIDPRRKIPVLVVRQ